ncbi:glycosyltransferase family 39 protein [bacterium]|nr:glycosyltransferase family 39 protein [bacterium]
MPGVTSPKRQPETRESTTRSRFLRAEFLLIMFALILRLGFVLSLDSHKFAQGPDQLLHDSLATNLIEGKGLSISESILYPPDGQPDWVKQKFKLYRELGGLWGQIRPGIPQITIPPVNPLILAFSYYIAGTGNLMPYRVIMALLGTISCWFVFDTTKRIFGHWTALLTLLCIAIHPALIYYTSVVLTETVFIFFFTAFVWALVRFREHQQSAFALLIGFFWSLGLLTKSIMVSMFPVAILLMLFPRNSPSRRFRGPVIFLLSAAVCLVPWVIRNYYIFDKIVILPTKSFNIWERNNYRFNDQFWQDGDTEAKEYEWILGRPPFKVNKPKTVEFPAFAPSDDEVRRNQKYIEAAREFILANPRLYIRLCVIRFFEFFRVLGRAQRSLIINAARIFPYGIILPLFVIGFFWSIASTGKVSRQKIVLIAALLVFISVHILTTAEPRYRLPIEPYMAAFASFTLVAIFKRKGNWAWGSHGKAKSPLDDERPDE